jgi:hypothetical protein
MTLDCVKWFELYGSHQPFETDVPQVKLLLLGLVFKKPYLHVIELCVYIIS